MITASDKNNTSYNHAHIIFNMVEKSNKALDGSHVVTAKDSKTQTRSRSSYLNETDDWELERWVSSLERKMQLWEVCCHPLPLLLLCRSASCIVKRVSYSAQLPLPAKWEKWTVPLRYSTSTEFYEIKALNKFEDDVLIKDILTIVRMSNVTKELIEAAKSVANLIKFTSERQLSLTLHIS